MFRSTQLPQGSLLKPGGLALSRSLLPQGAFLRECRLGDINTMVAGQAVRCDHSPRCLRVPGNEELPNTRLPRKTAADPEEHVEAQTPSISQHYSTHPALGQVRQSPSTIALSLQGALC